MKSLVADLFAGPGGWDVGARSSLGLEVLGLERDRWACATRAAAGLRTVRADVANFPLEPLAGRVDGLIASPPCPAFSAAGDRRGTAQLGALCAHVARCADGWVAWDGDPNPLVWLSLEPLRWALTLEPTWLALEQVPPVLPLWQAYEATLRHRGWRTWVGVLCAADFGVPQTRRRAFLLAHHGRQPWPPEPTHAEHPGALFGLEPWVSMADALGWGWGDPARTACGDRRRFLALRTNAQANATVRTVDEPAPTILGSTDNGDTRWLLHTNRGQDEEGSRQDAEGAVRVELHELSVLQGFPADYPWQRNKTQRAQQIGNAVPPLRAVAL